MVFAAGLFVFLFSSCYKTDPDKISDDFVWSPDISLPIGSVQPEFNESVGQLLYGEIDFSLSDLIEEREQIDSLMIRLNIKNEFPTIVSIIVYYQYPDPQNILIDETDIAPGKIDDEGKSTIPRKKQSDNWLNATRIDGLFASDKLIIRARLSDTNFDKTKYKIEVQLALQAHLTLTNE